MMSKLPHPNHPDLPDHPGPEAAGAGGWLAVEERELGSALGHDAVDGLPLTLTLTLALIERCALVLCTTGHHGPPRRHLRRGIAGR